MEADVFRPQSVGRAVRTAFVLGVLIVIAIVAAVAAVGNFSALVGDNTKDELSRYLDDNEHSSIKPNGAGFTLSFPVPVPGRESERVSTDEGAIDAPRDSALVDDEITFDVVWFDLRATPTDINKFLSSMTTRQVRQLSATRIAASPNRKVGKATVRDFVAVKVDQSGLKRYYDEEILIRGRRVWVMRVGSRIRRDAAFKKFVASFTFTY